MAERRLPLNTAMSLLLSIGVLHAAVVHSRVSQDTLTVGDRIELRIGVVGPKGATVVPPETENGFGDFVVKEWSTERTERETNDSTTFRYVVATYTSAACSIPSLVFLMVVGEEADTLYSPPVPMRLMSVVTSDSADIKDLKPQLQAGKPSLLWLWITIGFAVAAALAALGWYLWQRLRKPPPPPPPQPPYDEAIEALNKLEALNLVKRGLIREYVFGLSEILKRYVERRFEVNAAEFTTEEMLAWVGGAVLADKEKRRMEWFFRTTDPVKFAKFIPDDDTLHRMCDEAREFVDATRPRPEMSGTDSETGPVAGKNQGTDTAVGQTGGTGN